MAGWEFGAFAALGEVGLTVVGMDNCISLLFPPEHHALDHPLHGPSNHQAVIPSPFQSRARFLQSCNRKTQTPHQHNRIANRRQRKWIFNHPPHSLLTPSKIKHSLLSKEKWQVNNRHSQPPSKRQPYHIPRIKHQRQQQKRTTLIFPLPYNLRRHRAHHADIPVADPG